MKTRPTTTMPTSAFASSRPDRLAAEALTAALIDDPFYAAITLDAIDRHEALTKYFEYSLWEGRQLGTVVVPDGDPYGAAIWNLPQPSDVAEQAMRVKHAAFETLLGPRGFDSLSSDHRLHGTDGALARADGQLVFIDPRCCPAFAGTWLGACFA